MITGQVSEHVSFFIQPDFQLRTSAAIPMRCRCGMRGENGISIRIRKYRLRLGLQRVPCSFDNWQASRQRMAIDRADATNSCQNSERDMGVSFMWSPKVGATAVQANAGLHMYGPGDYGVFTFRCTTDRGSCAGSPAQTSMWARDWHGCLNYRQWLLEVGVNAMRGQFVVNHGTVAAGQTLYSL